MCRPITAPSSVCGVCTNERPTLTRRISESKVLLSVVVAGNTVSPQAMSREIDRVPLRLRAKYSSSIRQCSPSRMPAWNHGSVLRSARPSSSSKLTSVPGRLLISRSDRPVEAIPGRYPATETQ